MKPKEARKQEQNNILSLNEISNAMANKEQKTNISFINP